MAAAGLLDEATAHSLWVRRAYPPGGYQPILRRTGSIWPRKTASELGPYKLRVRRLASVPNRSQPALPWYMPER